MAAAQSNQVAIVASPGVGHFAPLAALARRLLVHYGVPSTLIVPVISSSPPQRVVSILQSLPPGIRHVLLPLVTFDDLRPQEAGAAEVFLAVRKSLPSIRQEVRSLHTAKPLLALVVDQFGTDAFVVADELCIPRHVFFPCSAMCLSLTLYAPAFDETVLCEAKDMAEPIRLPGCVPIHGRDLMQPLQERGKKMYSWFLHHAKQLRLADGILLNSYVELEPHAIRELRNGGSGNPPIYPVGPIVSSCSEGEGGGGEYHCMRWLDERPPRSVVLVSLGSGGTLSAVQQEEMAFGLEMSNQGFLWVVRPPNDASPNAAYHGVDGHFRNLESFLPEGFLERVEGRGLLVPNWAPQTDILGHASIGGFLSHCGWNSSLEGIVSGVPMIAWPLYAEQRANAALLVDGLSAALTPEKYGEAGRVVPREEVARVIRELMEGPKGKKLRRRVVEFRTAAQIAMADGGASAIALAHVTRKWMESLPNAENGRT